MSAGFGFGAKTTATPAFGTGSITFGTPAAQPAQQFGFGNLATPTPSPFGTQPTTTATAFGNPLAKSSTSFAFGVPSMGQPSTAPSTGFSLGTQAASTGLSFGPPAANPGMSFGTPAASTGLTFGTPAPSTGLSFGAPATTTGLSFGTPAASTGLSFGTPAASTGLSFSTPTTSTGLSFGTPAASTGLSFGTPAPSTGLSFGTPASTATAPTALGFKSPAATSGVAFGVGTSGASTGLSFGTTTTAPTLGLSFGTTTAATPSLNFGTTTSSTGFSFGGATSGLGGLSTLAPTLNLTSAASTQSVGLGGVASSQTKQGASTAAQKELPPKEQLLPNEFSQLVDHFKTVVQEEKTRSSDVARSSVREFRKVENELDALSHQFNQLENLLMNNRNIAEQLKYDTAKGLQSTEIAQRTQDTPPTLQFENTAPLQFFLDLADSFERDLQMLKTKIDNTAKFVRKCNEPNVLTSQDLGVGLKRLHETFVALAGRMQAVHNQVEAQKEAFLSLRKQTTKDNLNPFDKIGRNLESLSQAVKSALKAAPPNLAAGPTPFNSIALNSNNITLAAQQTPPPPYPTATTSALGFGSSAPTFGSPATNASLFKPTGFGTSPFQINTNFQLQKPPTGSKRGKQ